MNSRFLTVAAIAGMLLAAGCGGGAGSSNGNLMPKSPAPAVGGGSSGSGSGSTATGSGASFSVSFLVPVAAGSAGSTSSSRSPKYVSPASTGLQIITSVDGVTTPTFALGTQATPLALQPAPLPGVSGNLNTGAYGVNSTSSPFTPGTAQLSGNITYSPGPVPPLAPVVGAIINVNTIPGSSTVTPAVGQTFTIKNTDAPNAGVLTATVNAPVNGTPGTGLLLTATVIATQAPPTIAGSNGLGWTTGNLITFSGANTVQSTYNYTFTQATGLPGYYTATVTFLNMQGAKNYVLGVVLTDMSNSNYVLSEGQTLAQFVNAAGPTLLPQLTLAPVVAGVYIATPTPATGGAPAGTFETTVFATDEKGYVIPSTTPASLALTDNGAAIKITPASPGGLTFGVFDLPGFTPLVATTPSQSPVAGDAAAFNNGGTVDGTMLNAGGTAVNMGNGGAGPYASITGSFITNNGVPSAPFTLPLTGAGTAGVGLPLNIACVAVGTQTLKVQLTNLVSVGTVGGYAYSAANYPAAGPTTLTSATSSTPSINCNPSITLPIN